MLVVLLAAIVLIQVLGDRLTTTMSIADAEQKTGESATRERVSLSIDFGDGQQQDFDDIGWHDGMTVADLLRAAPELAIAQRGSGQGTFLTAIGDIANEGADGKNWTYEVNGQRADRSFAVYELRSGDRVLWRFGPQR
jgi:hypothetical protein